MALRFIYGRAGSGKSYFCYNDIKNKIEAGSSTPLVLLVPEDFSFQAEKDLLRVVGEKGLMQARVLSFKRMAHAVFGEVGGLARRYMNSAGRSMLLYRIMDEVKDDLKVFSKAVRTKGFVKTMSDMITELKIYDVSPELLGSMAAGLDNLPLREKLDDICLIFSRFESLLHSGYIDPDDDLAILYHKLDKSSMFTGSEIWVDGFSVFTPQQYRVLEKLLKKAERVNVTLCMESSQGSINGRSDIFLGIRNMEARILKIAQDNNISYEKPVDLNDGPCYKFRNHPELHHLERNIYAYPFEIYNSKTFHVNLFCASNRYSEVEDTARDIIRLCRDLDFRMGDIAVITRDVESYEKLVSAIFSQYEIPYFLDKKRDIGGNPLVVLVQSALEILCRNWAYEPVFRYLKTGLLNIGDEDIDMLENYVLASGIKGSRWTDGSVWRYWPDYGYEGELPDDAKDRLGRINSIRETVSQPLIALCNKVGQSSRARDIASSLFDFLEEINVYDRLQSITAELEQSGDHSLSDEYGKVWNTVMDILDQIAEVLGDQQMTLDTFLRVLSIGFDGCSVGLIPPTLDQVMFGGVERIKSHSVRALYILGVNDGLFPAVPCENGVLNDSDRESLKGLGVELAPCTRDSIYDEQFMVYTALTRTDGYLRISYPVADHEGKPMRPSGVISRLRKIFGSVNEYSSVIPSDDDTECLRCINNPASTFNSLVESMRRSADGIPVNPIWQEVHRWFMSQAAWQERMEGAACGITYRNQAGRIDRERIKSLYGKSLRLSISRLERYAGCPFSYFVQYGLRARDRKIYEFSAPDLGSFMHKILDNFSIHLDSSKRNWRDLERDECSLLVSSIVDDTVGSMAGSILSSSARYKYLKERLKRIMLRAVWLIACHIKSGGFDPLGYEVAFEYNGKYPPISLELPSGEKVSLAGRIDRVDVYNGGECIYVRVVDYKSGSKAFDLSDIYSGIEFQLLIYLDAILEHMSKESSKPVYPGGILYFKIDDPIIDTNGELSPEDVEREIIKRLKMKGLLLSDVKVVREMDKNISGYSIIIPAMMKSDGTLGPNSSTATREEFEALRRHVKNKIIGLCQDMLDGNIDISPYKNDRFTPCSFCSFKAVCKFDSNMEENRFRRITRLKADEVWRALRQSTGIEGGKS